MIYIKNNLRYAVSFGGVKHSKDFRVMFDCLRIYSDTGNIATTGVTAIEDVDYEILYSTSKDFKYAMDNGSLEKTVEGALSVANKFDAIAKENEELKAKLAEKTKAAATATSKELTAANKEIKSLKAQLEALKKKAE